jgi:regulatory protein
MNDDKFHKLKVILPVRITNIKPQKKRSDRYSLFHEDTFLIGLSGDTLLRYKVQKGDLFTVKLLQHIHRDEELQAIKDAGYRYLASRDHGSEELRRKIVKKGLSPELTEDVISDFKEEGLIDDRKFAEKFAADKLEFKKWGPVKIKTTLLKKGVDRDIAQKVTRNLSDNLEQQGICVDLLCKRRKHFLRETDTFKRKQKMYRYLAGKGFRSPDIRKALEKIKGEFDVK